jgi:ATP-binding cassette subfamily B multidrug efflux pump
MTEAVTDTNKIEKQIQFEPPKKRLKLSAYLFKYPKYLGLHSAGGVAYQIMVIFGAVFLGRTIDAALALQGGTGGLSDFYFSLGIFLGLSILFQAARFFKRFYNRRLNNLLKGNMRAGMLSNLLDYSLERFSREKSGDLMSRITGDVEQVAGTLRQTVTEIWDTALMISLSFITLIMFDARITLLASIPIPLVIILALFLRKPLYRLNQKSRRAAAKANVRLQQNITGTPLLRLYGLWDENMGRYEKTLKKQYRLQLKIAAIQSGMRPLYGLIAILGVVLVFGLGGERIVAGQMTVGGFTAYLSIFLAMALRIRVVARIMNQWQGAKASWDRIKEKLDDDTAPDTCGKNETENISAENIEVRLTVKDLSFSYPNTLEPILKNISFSAKAGQIIGITAPVGAGKSALAAALSGLYAYSGSAELSGTEIRALKDRSKISYLDSDNFVFSDELSFNIGLEREGADIEAAAKLAGLSVDLENDFPNGFNTVLGERGVRASGGQRQRISLARAWCAGGELLILDDPFSAIEIICAKILAVG